ncbi:SGNH/GDSL hydrolase family protein [uncultured Friedmanniella sp.]|uniref:SGNH/GDSL hydrolase family protein n=1 Tax=uncultured Friedmanniella sp. TaxID=335381 RepID=UPI0035CC9EB9
MVALGSSFAAGPGITPVIDRQAGRSGLNYAHLVAGRLGLELVDATVSGATTSTILDTPQRVGRRTFAPQVSAVTPDASLVTITAAGNDLGYLRGVMTTAILNRAYRRTLLRPLVRRLRVRLPPREVSRQAVEDATEGLARIVVEVHHRSPAARVVLVDYLPIFTAATTPDASALFENTEIADFRRVADIVTGVFETAGRRAGAEVVTARRYSQPRGTATTSPWVFGLRPLRQLGSSFHPTAAGMEEVARVLVDHLATDGAAPGGASG